MNLNNMISKMNTNSSIWHYTDYFRVTYVCEGWLIVWDHRQSPPTRYDCRDINHDTACNSVVDKLVELAIN